ncbi:urokinase plasminogen activator surface receptor-like isoform X2 [Bombina bombina]|uniref:urokinase plasminogen activator surface receptor-like isoform X2 n=1 Tax=Bombina bombina TaxID=8345 RepID=UPI00235AA389|nr:urokinase plasminogen activator surface receptor-like isoform X2 [Bombina bombina]
MGKVWKLLFMCLNISQVLSLRCLQCIGSSSSCRMSTKRCPAYETTCISLAYRSKDGVNTVMKGCSLPVLCNQTSVIDIGSQSIYMSATCCETDYCNINRYSTVSVFSNRLQCYICKDPNKTCIYPNLQPFFCDQVNNWCMDVITREITNGKETSTSFAKGCGSVDACNTLQGYNTGIFEHYTQYKCCNNGDFCNNAQESVSILKNNNGISCWGCYETGRNECAVENQIPVKCKGLLIRCMEVFDKNRKTVMKGCSTVSYCSSSIPSHVIPNITEIQCCAGSFCNNFTREFPIEPQKSSARCSYTDYKLLVFFLSFLYATIMKCS